MPQNVYNMWRPFEMERYTTPYTKRLDALQVFLDHIKILCNHDIPVYEYFIKWIAQMIQYPETKTIMPTLISNQGAGKGLFSNFWDLCSGQKRFLRPPALLVTYGGRLMELWLIRS